MISEVRLRPAQAFVWIWLPGAADPVVAARLTDRGPRMSFVYGQSYLARHDAIALSLPDLALQSGEVLTRDDVPGCIADAGPDSWGRRVIERRLRLESGGLSTLGYLLESGSNRIGAIDLQHDPDTYVPRHGDERRQRRQGQPSRSMHRPRPHLQARRRGGGRPRRPPDRHHPLQLAHRLRPCRTDPNATQRPMGQTVPQPVHADRSRPQAAPRRPAAGRPTQPRPTGGRRPGNRTRTHLGASQRSRRPAEEERAADGSARSALICSTSSG